MPALFAVAEGPFVHIHAYKSIGEFQVHLSGELHGVIQRFFAVLQAIGNAVPDGFRDLAPKTWSQGFADGVASERKRQTRLFLPPDAEINHLVQTLFLEEKLSFVNEQTGFDKIVLNCINNFVERHDHGFKVGFEKPQRKIRRGFRAGNSDASARQFLPLHCFCRNYNRSVTFAEAGAAIEKHVFVAKLGIGGETDGRDVVRFLERRFVERLDVRQNMRVFVAGGGKLVGRQRVEHERVIGIRRMRKLDFDRRWFGLRGSLLARHGLVVPLLMAVPDARGHFHC